MTMDTADIQKRIDAMPAAMSAKGLREPEAMYWINANSYSQISMQWKRTKPDHYGSKTHFEVIKADTVSEILDKADAFIAAMPSPDAARHQEFMDALGDVIDLGRQNGIDVAYVNPLTETMKKLSENALTYQKEAAE